MNIHRKDKLTDIVSEANPLSWSEYLEREVQQSRLDLVEQANKVKRYNVSNAHYIVQGDDVYTCYGYHGKVLFNLLAHGKAVYTLG